MQCEEILDQLKSLSNQEAVAGMARFGINPVNTFGVSIPILRKIARETGKNHILARELWSSRIHEARILACLMDIPELVNEEQMEKWVVDFDSWDICDQCCSNLFDKTSLAYQKAIDWSSRNEEFVKRAGFVMMATLAVHDKMAADKEFLKFLPLIKKEAVDNRNFVRKAVNWALRQIGKRNMSLNGIAIETAKEILEIDSRTAKWVASNALAELTNEKVRKKLRG